MAPTNNPTVPLEGQLCMKCSTIDLRLAFNLGSITNIAGNILGWPLRLGYLKDIAARPQCPLCRLVVHALLARWPTESCNIEVLIKSTTTDGDQVTCYAHSTEAGRRYTSYFAYQLSISTNITLPVGFSLPLSSRGDIAVLAVNAQGLGNEPLYHARFIGETIDFGLLHGWLSHCETKHFGRCNKPPWENMRVLPKSLRVIDVQRMCLVRSPAFPRYLALSYVWGNTQTLRATRTTFYELNREGYLSSKGHGLSTVIEDAIEVTRRLGERYLWVDQLCIIQDDPEDKLLQISQMDLIYAQAVLTIVAACSEDANGRLIGLRPGERDGAQVSSIITGLGLVVYFQCRLDVMAEDTVCERHSSRLGFDDYGRAHRVLSTSRGIDLGQWQWPMTLTDYAIAIELYTARHLRFPEDILVAFLGVQNILQKSARWKFWRGLPEERFDYAILWRPKGKLERRQLSRGTPKMSSLSWASWNGAVQLRVRANVLVSHVERFDLQEGHITRQIRRRVRKTTHADETFPDGLMYDVSAEPSLLRHTLPEFSNSVQTLKRLLNISSTSTSSNNTAAAIDEGPLPPVTLRFRAFTANFTVSRQPIFSRQAEGERDQHDTCKRPSESVFDEISSHDFARQRWIYDKNIPPRRIGTVWEVACMDEEIDNYDEALFVLLSQEQCLEQDAIEWQYDLAIGESSPWCMLNVMQVRSVRNPTGDLMERVSIGMIHDAAWRSATPVKRELVLG